MLDPQNLIESRMQRLPLWPSNPKTLTAPTYSEAEIVLLFKLTQG